MESQDLKVVAHRSDGTLIKGYTEGVPEFYAASLSKPDPVAPPEKLRLKTIDDGNVEVPLDDLKALFFVRSFEGSQQYTEVKFFKSHPIVEGLWVRLRFHDNELT